MRNNRLAYNLSGIMRMLAPRFLLPSREKILHSIQTRDDVEYIKQRVDYYCQLDSKITLDENAKNISCVRFAKKKTMYNFDAYEFTRYFPQDFKAYFEFGDVNYICPKPSITKSRPTQQALKDKRLDSSIAYKNGEIVPFSNSTLLNLEKIRHFTFINDPYTFSTKQDKLFYRGGIYQAHRTQFFEKYFNHPLCDLGHTGHKSVHHAWQKPKISIAKHLPYKFLLSLEGNDVASNLKWVMSSNSLAVMPKPKFETWFMEGNLEPDIHYLQIRDDYADVEERLEYCLKNPSFAEGIIHNAYQYVKQFFDRERESIISLLVLEKYFYYTGQIDSLRI